MERTGFGIGASFLPDCGCQNLAGLKISGFGVFEGFWFRVWASLVAENSRIQNLLPSGISSSGLRFRVSGFQV